MENINKLQSFIILGMVSLGILIGQIDVISIYSEHLIMPALMIMLFLVFIQIPIKGAALYAAITIEIITISSLLEDFYSLSYF